MRICVYCSANNNIPDKYKVMAHEFGQWIGKNGHTLVFGGATGGLMTEVANGASEAGAPVVGIVPQRIIDSGRKNDVVTELHVVGTMNERKDLLKQTADIFVALPGSYGTLDELFDVVASGTVGEHRKPLVLLNVEGFYDCLLEQIKRMKTECFIPAEERYSMLVAHTIAECEALLTL